MTKALPPVEKPQENKPSLTHDAVKNMKVTTALPGTEVEGMRVGTLRLSSIKKKIIKKFVLAVNIPFMYCGMACIYIYMNLIQLMKYYIYL